MMQLNSLSVVEKPTNLTQEPEENSWRLNAFGDVANDSVRHTELVSCFRPWTE
jgi:hypothetical protein